MMRIKDAGTPTQSIRTYDLKDEFDTDGVDMGELDELVTEEDVLKESERQTLRERIAKKKFDRELTKKKDDAKIVKETDTEKKQMINREKTKEEKHIDDYYTYGAIVEIPVLKVVIVDNAVKYVILRNEEAVRAARLLKLRQLNAMVTNFDEIEFPGVDDKTTAKIIDVKDIILDNKPPVVVELPPVKEETPAPEPVKEEAPTPVVLDNTFALLRDQMVEMQRQLDEHERRLTAAETTKEVEPTKEPEPAKEQPVKKETDRDKALSTAKIVLDIIPTGKLPTMARLRRLGIALGLEEQVNNTNARKKTDKEQLWYFIQDVAKRFE